MTAPLLRRTTGRYRVAKAPRYDGVHNGLDTTAAAHIVLEALAREISRATPAVLRGDDTRAVHDMRVSIRRLRSALETIGETIPSKRRKAMRRAARRIGGKLGPVRDADVHLAVLRAALAGAPSIDRAGIAFAIDTIGDRRRTALTSFAIELSQIDRDLFIEPIARAIDGASDA